MGYNLKPSYSSVDEMQTRDRAITVLYGRTPDALGGNIVPIKVDASGNLSVGTGLTLTASDIDLGDFVMKGVTDPALQGDTYTPGEERIGLIRVGDASAPDPNLHQVLVRDSRMSFIGGALSVTTSSTPGNVYAPQTINVVSPTYDTFASTGITAYTAVGYKDKSFVARNTGANSCQVRAFVSVDGGINYDVPILVASTLAAGAAVWIDDSRAWTGIRFEIQRGAGDTTVQLKGFAQ